MTIRICPLTLNPQLSPATVAPTDKQTPIISAHTPINTGEEGLGVTNIFFFFCNIRCGGINALPIQLKIAREHVLELEDTIASNGN
jgi:hypothetical protein